MKNIITLRFAAVVLMAILGAIVIFHLLVISGVIPYQMVWGGRLADRSQMLRFETISILTNLVMLTVVMIRAGFVRLRVHPISIRIALWLMVGLFLLNTIGNLLSNNETEKIIFTPLTVLLCLLSLRLATSRG